MAKCGNCRQGDNLHALCGDNYSCVNCGHTGPAAGPVEVEAPKSRKKDGE